MKIEFSIKEIKNGWTVYNSYEDNSAFCKDYNQVKKEVNKILKKLEKEFD